MISSKRFRAGNDVQEALECNFKKETSMIVTHSRKNWNIEFKVAQSSQIQNDCEVRRRPTSKF